jgi:hypothetical protein
LLDQLIRDGKLYLSLKDAIRLALENNLDLAHRPLQSAHRQYGHTAYRAGGIFRA